MKRLAVLVPVAVALAACGSSDAGSDGDGPTVLASFYPLAFVADRVAGDNASIGNLTQPGGEPHDLELSAQQVGQVADSDLAIYLHGFQPSVDAAIEQNASDKALDVEGLVETIPAEDEHEHEEDGHEHEEDGEEHEHEGDRDPHVWLDPANMIAITEGVADKLGEIDSDNKDAYQAHADDLIKELETLDADYDEGLKTCERNTFVTSHAAFGYLAHRYDLHQVGISGIDPEAEPSPQRLSSVQDVVQDEGVTTVFYERLVSPKVAETMATDLGVEAAVLDPIEGLTDDTSDEDYLTLMRANLDALRQANGCQ